MTARRRSRTWTEARTLTVGTTVVVALAALILPFWPLSGSLWLIALVAGLAWPRPELFEFESPAQEQATRARAYGRTLLRLSPRIYGFGSPGTIEEQPPTLWPPNRVSAWAAAAAAVGVAAIEFAVAVPLFQGTDPEGPMILWRHPAVSFLSLPFTYALVQAGCHIARQTTDPDGPAPAALWDPAEWPEEFAEAGKRPYLQTGLAAAIPTFITVGPALALLVAWQFDLTLIPPVVHYPAAIVVALSVGVCAAARSYIIARVAKWKADQENRRQWNLRWSTIPRVGNNPPQWVVDHDLPADNPTHTIAAFTIGVGGSFDLYEEAAPKLAPALGSDMILIAPLASLGEDGRTIPGTAQYGGFTVIWSHVKLGPRPHLLPNLDPATRRFAVRWAFTNAFKALNLGRPEFVGITSLSAPDSEAPLLETSWRLAPGTTFEKVAAKAHELQEKLDAPWLRVGRRYNSAGEPSEHISILFGEHPDQVKLRPPAAATRRLIDSMNWAAWFREAKLVGTDGTVPQLEHKEINARGIAEMEFRTAAGLAVSEVRKGIPALSASSGYAYVEVEPVEEANRFRLVAGKVDPLNDAYLFNDYWDILMTDPVPGSPKIDWYTGIGADGELIQFHWDGEEPHLLIAGSSGSGKSQIVNSMLCQLFHNNTPDDVEVWMMEPKNELHAFADVAHVKRFIDGQTPGDSAWSTAAALLDEAREEMHRRYTLFASHPAKPQKLSEARYIAHKEGPLPDGSRHPLDIPYLFVIIEECSNYFTPPALKRFREDYESVIYNVEEIARLARAAGIHLVVATQYPTNRTISPVLKQQCRRLGLKTNSVIASMVVIDEPGLDEIKVPGRGMISAPRGYRGFRGFFMRRPDEDNPDAPDDRAAILDLLPKVHGRTFSVSGASTDAEAPQPDPGIWDDEETPVA